MPILARHRWLNPIDWRELSASIRFRRAKGRCEGCERSHGRVVLHLGDGRWWDEDARIWRCGQGRRHRLLPPPHSVILPMWRTRVLLSTCHLDHDPTDNEAAHPAVFWQRRHFLRDKAKHLRLRAVRVKARRAWLNPARPGWRDMTRASSRLLSAGFSEVPAAADPAFLTPTALDQSNPAICDLS